MDKAKTAAKRSLGIGQFLLATAAVALIGRAATKKGMRSWYRRLKKSPLQPPAWAFGPVWTVLYGLMSASAYRVFQAAPSPARTRALRLWWTQLALNGAWSPLFFGARRPRLALADIAALAVATTSYLQVARGVDRTAGWMMTPYLGWTTYAGLLNGDIIRRNPRLLS